MVSPLVNLKVKCLAQGQIGMKVGFEPANLFIIGQPTVSGIQNFIHIGAFKPFQTICLF